MFILGIKINTLFERKTFIKYRSNREENIFAQRTDNEREREGEQTISLSF